VNFKRPLRLGFVPLNDAASLIVALNKGFFAAEGLNVQLIRESSWATLRDMVCVGALDGAHMLAPLALATTIGAGREAMPMTVSLALNHGGAAITVSTRVAASSGEDISADGLAGVIARRKAREAGPLTFGVVHPFSIHNYLLRDWLARGGIEPDRDVRLTQVHPPSVAQRLAEGVIEGFCVGEPWNQVAVRARVGRIAVRASQALPGAPDKVFAVTEAWARNNGPEYQALLRALLRASAWIEAPENALDLVAVLAKPSHVGVSQEAIAMGLGDIRYHRGGANQPRAAHVAWILEQMARWGQIAPSPEITAAADRVFRPDLFEEARRAVEA
jgi:NitT/TauT family transport system ATP-binding protein/nitrate/nitrite transport system substrate-binding protein